MLQVELLYFEGCASYQTAARLLREALIEEGVSPAIETIRIEDEVAAQRLKFVGSPTIRINGIDPFLSGEANYGLECRLFTTPEGLKGWPTKAMLREALKRHREPPIRQATKQSGA